MLRNSELCATPHSEALGSWEEEEEEEQKPTNETGFGLPPPTATLPQPPPSNLCVLRCSLMLTILRCSQNNDNGLVKLRGSHATCTRFLSSRFTPKNRQALERGSVRKSHTSSCILYMPPLCREVSRDVTSMSEDLREQLHVWQLVQTHSRNAVRDDSVPYHTLMAKLSKRSRQPPVSADRNSDHCCAWC